MKGKILQAIAGCLSSVEQLKLPSSMHFLENGALALADCFQQGGKVLVAGNGGSLCDAAHFAEELTGFFRKKRRALPAIALSEPGHITCVSNDLGFEHVFSRAIEAYGKPGDIFVGLTTSGNSPNMVNAFMRAKELGLKTISFLGKSGGKLKGYADFELLITGADTSDRIQEAHKVAIHILIELVEEYLFYQTEQQMLQEIISAVKG